MPEDIKNLNTDELKEVSGGTIFAHGADKEYPWEIISDFNGNVLGKYRTREDAEEAAKKMGVSTRLVNYDYIKHLRDMH